VAAITVALNLAAMGGAHRATAVGFVSAFNRLPVHPANTKANNRAMILIRAIYPNYLILVGFLCGTLQVAKPGGETVTLHADGTANEIPVF
jgi:hypothetical protein